MKIAFVNEWYERFGVEYISAVLKANGHEVGLFIDPRLFDDEDISVRWLANVFDYKKRLIGELKAFQPDLVSFSISTDSYQWALRISKLIKAEMHVPIIFGGIHPTSVPERVIHNESIDMVCVGEGEYAMLELVNSMEKGQVDYAIKNIWFKKNGNVIRNEVRPLIEDLDALPIPDKELYYSANPHLSEFYYIITRRGCVNSCSYCCHSCLRRIYVDKGQYSRQRSIDNIIEELVNAKNKYKIRLVRFWDDDFIVGRDRDWFKEFTRKYKYNVNLPFICYLYPQQVSIEIIQYLREAGCCEVNIGVQSWDDSLRRDVLHRNTPNTRIEEVVDMLKRKRINTIIDFICGLPYQTEEDAINILKFFALKRIGKVYFFGIQYFPNVDMTLKMQEQGYFSGSQYEDILDGKRSKFIHLGGHIPIKNIMKLKIIVLLIKAFPANLSTYIIESKFSSLINSILPWWLVEGLYNLFMCSYDQKYTARLKRGHYLHSILRIAKLSNWIQS